MTVCALDHYVDRHRQWQNGCILPCLSWARPPLPALGSQHLAQPSPSSGCSFMLRTPCPGLPSQGIKARLRAAVPSSVIMEEFMGPADMVAAYRQARINFHPATYDAFGMTIVEAASQVWLCVHGLRVPHRCGCVCMACVCLCVCRHTSTMRGWGGQTSTLHCVCVTTACVCGGAHMTETKLHSLCEPVRPWWYRSTVSRGDVHTRVVVEGKHACVAFIKNHLLNPN